MSIQNYLSSLENEQKASVRAGLNEVYRDQESSLYNPKNNILKIKRMPGRTEVLIKALKNHFEKNDKLIIDFTPMVGKTIEVTQIIIFLYSLNIVEKIGRMTITPIYQKRSIFIQLEK